MEILKIHKVQPTSETGIFELTLDFIGFGGARYESAGYRLDINDPNGLAPSLTDLVALMAAFDVEFDEPLAPREEAPPAPVQLTRKAFEAALIYGANEYDVDEFVKKLAAGIEHPQQRAVALLEWRSIGLNDPLPRTLKLFDESNLNHANLSIETFDALWAVALKNQ